MKNQGWSKEPVRHGLAARGIKTTYVYHAKGKPTLSVGLPSYTKEKVQLLNDTADGKEWIAELIIINGSIFIDDIQVSGDINRSYLRWNTGDDKRDIGYIHYHPPGIIPEFSAQDFVLAFNIHGLRTNKKQYPYTIMGLVYPENGTLKVVVYGVRPKPNRVKQFEGLEAVESDMKDVIGDMIKKKELVKLRGVDI